MSGTSKKSGRRVTSVKKLNKNFGDITLNDYANSPVSAGQGRLRKAASNNGVREVRHLAVHQDDRHWDERLEELMGDIRFPAAAGDHEDEDEDQDGDVSEPVPAALPQRPGGAARGPAAREHGAAVRAARARGALAAVHVPPLRGPDACAAPLRGAERGAAEASVRAHVAPEGGEQLDLLLQAEAPRGGGGAWRAGGAAARPARDAGGRVRQPRGGLQAAAGDVPGLRVGAAGAGPHALQRLRHPGAGLALHPAPAARLRLGARLLLAGHARHGRHPRRAGPGVGAARAGLVAPPVPRRRRSPAPRAGLAPPPPPPPHSCLSRV
ncbi:translation initiation factor IF-2 isoform X4 [Bacillus rossius redtenbacheri]